MAVDAPYNTVAHWENNRQIPSDPFQLVKLAGALDTTVEALFGATPIREAHKEAYLAGVRETAAIFRQMADEIVGRESRRASEKPSELRGRPTRPAGQEGEAPSARRRVQK